MGWFRDHLFVISLCTFLVSSLVSVLVVGFGAVVVLSALLSGSLTLDFLVGLWPLLLVLAVLVSTTVLSGLGLGWSAFSRLSVPSISTRRITERLHPLVQTLEQHNATLASLSLSERVAPPEPPYEEKLQQLKQQYVGGEINEAEFERRVERLTTVDTTPVDAVRERNIERER